MANYITHHGEAQNVIWGAGKEFTAFGFLQSQGTQKDGQVAELKDEDGELRGLSVFNKKNVLTAEITMKKSQRQPEFGEIITIDGKKYICRGSNLQAENENYAKLSLTVENYAGVVLS